MPWCMQLSGWHDQGSLGMTYEEPFMAFHFDGYLLSIKPARTALALLGLVPQ